MVRLSGCTGSLCNRSDVNPCPRGRPQAATGADGVSLTAPTTPVVIGLWHSLRASLSSACLNDPPPLDWQTSVDSRPVPAGLFRDGTVTRSERKSDSGRPSDLSANLTLAAHQTSPNLVYDAKRTFCLWRTGRSGAPSPTAGTDPMQSFRKCTGYDAYCRESRHLISLSLNWLADHCAGSETPALN
jgi:hypothetical protein